MMESPTAPIDRLNDLLHLHGTKKVAERLEALPRTIERWASGENKYPPHVDKALDRLFGIVPSGSIPKDGGTKTLKFVDLFAGIGGLRLALESTGAECVFTSEWDKYAVQTYEANHASSHQLLGDIREIMPEAIPDHDVLVGGFPCQPFSLAGVSKKNALGRSHGFLDETQGTLFFNVAAIIAEKRPRAVLLENVKNLKSHDGGKTFDVISRVLREELGYRLHTRVIDAKGFVPQHRERLVMVAFRDGEDFDWTKVSPAFPQLAIGSILHSPDDLANPLNAKYLTANGTVEPRYTLSDKLWAYLQAYAAKHRAAGNGFGFGLVGPNDHTRTLSARYYKDGSEILLSQGAGLNPRRLTPRECCRLMGFPDSFKIPVSDTQAYKQFGNSVAVPLFKSVAQELVTNLGNWKK